MIAAWDPAASNTNLSFSTGNTIATAQTTTTDHIAKATIGVTSGKWFWKVTMNTVTSAKTTAGLANPTASVVDGHYLSNDTNSLGWLCSSGGVFINLPGVPGQIATWATFTNGANLFFALDVGAKLLWGRVETSGNWNNNVSANPATGTLGADISALAAGAIFPAVDLWTAATDQATCNFSPTETAPSGFSPLAGPFVPSMDNLPRRTLITPYSDAQSRQVLLGAVVNTLFSQSIM